MDERPIRTSWHAGVVLLCMLLSSATVHAAARRVLVIHSFGREFAPFDSMFASFRTELASRSPDPIEFSEVAIETARFAATGNEVPLLEYLRALHDRRPLDLILTIAEPATHFALQNRATLFPETPLLAHVDHRYEARVRAVPNSFLAPVYVELPILIENILEVLPATTEVAMILGASPFERVWADHCRREFARFEGRVNVTYLNDLPLDTMCDRVSKLRPGSVVLYGMLAVDAAGVPYEQEKALARLHAAAAVPIFGVFESQMGHGVVGGPLISLEESGRHAAHVALRILGGEKANDVEAPGRREPGRCFDWRELKRWGIDEASLPEGSRIRYRPPSLWEEHRGLILATLGVILAQVVTIAALATSHARRRRSEDRLRESEARMNLAAGAANLGMWVWDLERDEIWATVKCRSFFGFSAEERVRFADFSARVHADDRPVWERAVRVALDEESFFDAEYRVCHPDGTSRWIAARGVAHGRGNTRNRRMLGVCIDTTQRKHAELELARRRSELAHVARVSAMGELAASLAHELNQPLGAILSNAETAEILLTRTPFPLEELKEILVDIRTDDERAGEVIRRMRTLLRRQELELRPLDVNLVVEHVLRLVQADAAVRRTAVVTELADSLPKVQGDAVHLQQVLLNLVLNGFEAIAARGGGERRLTIRTGETGGMVEIAVTDSGTGIEPGAVERLFEPFYSTKPDGMGMGLSIARTIVEAHRGRIRATNERAGGATFHVSLPLTPLSAT